MSPFKINSITDKSGTSTFCDCWCGTNNSTGCMIIPADDPNYKNIPEGVATDGLLFMMLEMIHHIVDLELHGLVI